YMWYDLELACIVHHVVVLSGTSYHIEVPHYSDSQTPNYPCYYIYLLIVYYVSLLLVYLEKFDRFCISIILTLPVLLVVWNLAVASLLLASLLHSLFRFCLMITFNKELGNSEGTAVVTSKTP
ncbi:hypothetical protein ACJX0J_032511, partial [Zea mays]